MPGAYLLNQIDSDAVITVSSEDSAYPKENIYGQVAAKVFRSESTTILIMQIDFGASVAANTIALVNHNLTSGATVTLKNNDTSPGTTITTMAYRASDMWKAFTSVSAQEWEIVITDVNTADIQIGQIILGTRVQFPVGRKIANGYIPAVRRINIGDETYGGVKWNYHLHQRREFNPSFLCRSAADLAVFSTLDTAVYGDHYPFLYIPNVSGSECYYVRKEIDFGPVEIDRVAGGEIAHEYTLGLVEESRGLEILA